MYSAFFINNIWAELTELLQTHQITIHEFHRTWWTDLVHLHCIVKYKLYIQYLEKSWKLLLERGKQILLQ